MKEHAKKSWVVIFINKDIKILHKWLTTISGIVKDEQKKT